MRSGLPSIRLARDDLVACVAIKVRSGEWGTHSRRRPAHPRGRRPRPPASRRHRSDSGVDERLQATAWFQPRVRGPALGDAGGAIPIRTHVIESYTAGQAATPRSPATVGLLRTTVRSVHGLPVTTERTPCHARLRCHRRRGWGSSRRGLRAGEACRVRLGTSCSPTVQAVAVSPEHVPSSSTQTTGPSRPASRSRDRSSCATVSLADDRGAVATRLGTFWADMETGGVARPPRVRRPPEVREPAARSSVSCTRSVVMTRCWSRPSLIRVTKEDLFGTPPATPLPPAAPTWDPTPPTQWGARHRPRGRSGVPDEVVRCADPVAKSRCHRTHDVSAEATEGRSRSTGDPVSPGAGGSGE